MEDAAISALLLPIREQAESLDPLKEQLRNAGCRVSVTRSLPEAVTLLENGPRIDLAIVATNGGDCDAVTETAQAIADTSDLPILFFVDPATVALIERLDDLPHYGCIPYDSGELVVRQWIANALELFRARHDLVEVRYQRESDELFTGVIDAIPDSLAVLDRNGTILAVNNAWRRFGRQNGLRWSAYGVGRSYLNPLLYAIRRDPADYPESVGSENDAAKTAELMQAILDAEEHQITFEYPCNSPRETRWFLMRACRFETRFGPRIVVTHTNITKRKLAEIRLQEMLDQKDRLMSELNHRVKNNLNMVSSLISLKDRSIGDAADLSDIRNQVRAIAFIHERLNQGDDISQVDFTDYLETLIHSVVSLHAGKRVRTEFDIDPITIDTRTAVTVGLILNELATNAMKHAFSGELPGDEEPVLSVRMRYDDETSKVDLSVANTGNPPNIEIDFKNPSTLGLQLISALVDQIQGSIEMRRTDRTEFHIRAPLHAERKHSSSDRDERA